MKNAGRNILLSAVLAGSLLAGEARAQDIMPAPPAGNPAGLNNVRPSILDQVGIDQKLGAQIDPNLVFKDDTGKDVRLGDYFGKRPIVLTLVYYECPMLCTVVLNQTLAAAKAMHESIGTDYDILTISFDPKETTGMAHTKRIGYLSEYNRAGADKGWHFLTGSEENIKKLTSTVGFKYAWDEKNKVYAHASGIMVLTPDGQVSKYFFGIDYVPNDMRLALIDAAGSKVGGVTETILLYCFHYDPATGRYGLAVDRALKVGGVLTILAIGSFIGLMARKGPHAEIDKNGAGEQKNS